MFEQRRPLRSGLRRNNLRQTPMHCNSSPWKSRPVSQANAHIGRLEQPEQVDRGGGSHPNAVRLLLVVGGGHCVLTPPCRVGSKTRRSPPRTPRRTTSRAQPVDPAVPSSEANPSAVRPSPLVRRRWGLRQPGRSGRRLTPNDHHLTSIGHRFGSSDHPSGGEFNSVANFYALSSGRGAPPSGDAGVWPPALAPAARPPRASEIPRRMRMW